MLEAQVSLKNKNQLSQDLADSTGLAEVKCTDLPPIQVTGYINHGAFYFWMGAGSWVYYTVYGGGGTSSLQINNEKLIYCNLKDKATALVSTLPITGSVATGYSIGQGFSTWARALILCGLRDIQVRVATGEPATGSYSDGTVNWQAASINWNAYNTWQSSDPNNPYPYNPTNSLPTHHNGGSKHIFAKWLLAKGQGNGNVNDMIG